MGLKERFNFRAATARATQGSELPTLGLSRFVGSTTGLEAF
jgi:hypothetical protein